jgi:hypothetical protein
MQGGAELQLNKLQGKYDLSHGRQDCVLAVCVCRRGYMAN